MTATFPVPTTYRFVDTVALSHSAEIARKLIDQDVDGKVGDYATDDIVADRQMQLDELHRRALNEYWGQRYHC